MFQPPEPGTTRADETVKVKKLVRFLPHTEEKKDPQSADAILLDGAPVPPLSPLPQTESVCQVYSPAGHGQGHRIALQQRRRLLD